MGRATSPLSDNWHREVDAALVACFSLALTLPLSLTSMLMAHWRVLGSADSSEGSPMLVTVGLQVHMAVRVCDRKLELWAEHRTRDSIR